MQNDVAAPVPGTLYNLNVRIVIKNVDQASRLSIFTTETVVLH